MQASFKRSEFPILFKAIDAMAIGCRVGAEVSVELAEPIDATLIEPALGDMDDELFGSWAAGDEEAIAKADAMGLDGIHYAGVVLDALFAQW